MEEKTEGIDVDEALLKIGTFNRWRIAVYSMVCTSFAIQGVWQTMSIVFTGGEPQHHCKLSEYETLNGSIPWELGKGNRWRHSQCMRYANLSLSNETIPCPDGWTYDRQEFQETIVTEWDLVCDNNYLVETSQSVFSFGVMIGAIVFTGLSDRFGRKPVHLACQYSMFILGLALTFPGNYVSFVVLRFFQGAVREGTGLTGIVMACELFPAVHRTFAGTALELYWAVAWMLMALIAYLIRHWRYLQLAVTLPQIWTISLIWLLPESIPWLVANDRTDEAEAILRKAAKHGNVQLPEPLLKKRNLTTIGTDNVEEKELEKKENKVDKENGEDQMEDGEAFQQNHSLMNSFPKTTGKDGDSEVRKADVARNGIFRCCPLPSQLVKQSVASSKRHMTCLDILRSPTMVLYTFILCALWFASGTIYYGLSLSTSTLAGDKYVNFFLCGAVEVPAYSMAIVVLKRFGRRWPLFFFHLTAAVVLFINIFIPHQTDGGVELTHLITVMTMVGKFAMTAAFGTVVLYTPEIYPTNLRNFGMGLTSCWARFGGIIAPFFSYLNRTNDWIASAAFAIIALVSGFMGLVLPETLDRPLPETFEEILSWKKTKLCKKSQEMGKAEERL